MYYETDEPVFITKNGYGDMLIMSMEIYEERLDMIEVYNRLAEQKKILNKEKYKMLMLFYLN